MVNVNVDIQNSGVNLQELKNSQNTVVDVAETRRLGLFGVVQATSPVDCNVSKARVKPGRASEGPSSGYLAKVPQTVKDGTILHDVKSLEGRGVILGTLRSYCLEKADVFVGMKPRHLPLGNSRGGQDLHLVEHAVGDDELVCHSNSVRLHRMTLSIVEVANLAIVVVGHLFLGCGRHLEPVPLTAPVFCPTNLSAPCTMAPACPVNSTASPLRPSSLTRQKHEPGDPFQPCCRHRSSRCRAIHATTRYRQIDASLSEAQLAASR
mmetsp:Transcript_314/g.1030  ORF Transcript_314/g.1030 Transcript_314/m.1030 type:complete len:265 (+) Transcript_314:1357-2151(+)